MDGELARGEYDLVVVSGSEAASAALARRSSQGVSAQSRVRRGQVLEEILAEATEGDYDLLVLGGHPRRTWFKGPERDLPANLLARSDRPVLVVKGP